MSKYVSNHASTTVFTGLGIRGPFPLTKTEETDERKAFDNDWGDKIKIETRFRSVSRIGKNAGISVLL